MSLFLGIDVGTTWCKAALFDERGAEHPAARRRTPWRPTATGAEADPIELADAALGAASEAIRNGPGDAVVGIGVASLAEAGVLLDRRGEPVLPVIAWHDVRGETEAARLPVDLPGYAARAGVPATKVLTIAKHAALRPAGAARWLNVAEWVARRLGGEERAELSLTSRTGYLDLRTGRAWPDAVEWAGMPADLIPETALAGSSWGRAAAFAAARRAVLTVAGHDHVAAAAGTGATGVGDLLDSHGTAEALVRTVAAGLPETEVAAAVARGISVAWHVVPDRWALVAGFASGKLLGEPGGRARIDELALRARAARDAIEAVAGPSDRLVAVGGWARDPEVAAAKRRRLGEFTLAPVEEAGCAGAALLARRCAESAAPA